MILFNRGLLSLFCFVFWAPWGLGADAVNELGTGQRAPHSSQTQASFENRPGQNECFRGIQAQLAYDLRTPSEFASFGLSWTKFFDRKSEDLQRVQLGANSCQQQFGASLNRPEPLSSFRQEISRSLSEKINPSMLAHIDGCQLQTEKQSKRLMSRYYYGLGTLERYLSTLVDQLASIESTLDGRSRLLGGRDCSYLNGPGAGQDPGLPFPELRKKCENYQKCSRLPENVMNDYYQDLQKDYERFLRNEAELKKLNSSQVRNQMIQMSAQGFASAERVTHDERATKIQDLENEQTHLLSQHAFLQAGSEFRKTMDHHFQLAGSPKAVLKEAYQKQRRSDVRLLNQEVIKYQRYVACFRNTAHIPEQCPDPNRRESLEEFTIDLKKADDLTGDFFSQEDSPTSLRYQACLANNSADEVKYLEIGQSAALDIALTAAPVGIAASTLAKGGRMALGRLTRLGASVDIGGGAYYTTQGLAAVAEHCSSEKEQLSQIVAQPENLNNLCPSETNPVSAAVRNLDACMDNVFAAAVDGVPFVAAGAASRTVRSAIGNSLDVSPSGRHLNTPEEVATTREYFLPGSMRDRSRPKTREQFIEDYRQVNFSSVVQNNRFIALADRPRDSRGVRFLDIENSIMKDLNDSYANKDFVNSVTNLHKQMIYERLEKLKKEFPTVQFVTYSDYKSVRVAFVPNSPTGRLPQNLEQRIAQELSSANDEYVTTLRSLTELRDKDIPENWFRAGFGSSADDANLAARFARQDLDNNRMRSLNSPDVQRQLSQDLRDAETHRASLERVLDSHGLASRAPESNSIVPSRDVFEVLRKVDKPENTAPAIQKRFGIHLTEAQATSLFEYGRIVDRFSPSLRVPGRSAATLTDHAPGGLNLDFSGLGAENFQSTAEALTQSRVTRRNSTSNPVHEAIDFSRAAERRVTESFNLRRQSIQKDIENTLRQSGVSVEIRSSGDDMVVRPSRSLTSAERQKIADAVARNQHGGSRIRISNVRPNIPNPEHRNVIGTHGEAAEKILREKLRNQLPPQISDRLTFMVDMDSHIEGQGTARLVIGNGVTTLTPMQRAQIQNAFRESIQDLNQTIKIKNQNATYQAGN